MRGKDRDMKQEQKKEEPQVKRGNNVLGHETSHNHQCKIYSRHYIVKAPRNEVNNSSAMIEVAHVYPDISSFIYINRGQDHLGTVKN